MNAFTSGLARIDLPNMYYRDDCFAGIFSAAYEPVRALLPSRKHHPVRLPGGRPVVVVAAFNYIETSLGPPEDPYTGYIGEDRKYGRFTVNYS